MTAEVLEIETEIWDVLLAHQSCSVVAGFFEAQRILCNNRWLPSAIQRKPCIYYAPAEKPDRRRFRQVASRGFALVRSTRKRMPV